MRFYKLFTHSNTLFNPSDTVIKCFSRCTYIYSDIGYNENRL